jgi:glutathione S-transferase
MPPLVLVSHHLCPYVQRAAIALAEKGVPHERVDIDLDAKPDWFLALSPTGKVPLLRVGGEAVFESSVICEYLEETQPRPLHPADPLERARHRAWMEFASAALGDVWRLETATDAAGVEAAAASLRARFVRVEDALGGGPWFAGERFALVDAAFAPVFRYFDTFDRLADLGVFDGLARTRAWRAALAARPSVRGAVAPDYGDRLTAFLDRKGAHLLRAARSA